MTHPAGYTRWDQLLESEIPSIRKVRNLKLAGLSVSKEQIEEVKQALQSGNDGKPLTEDQKALLLQLL